MKKIISLLLCTGMLVSIGACSKKSAMTWQEQYDLGVRYLSEGNYQEAIIAFEAAITIDPQQADGYVHLAEAYMQLGDFENAARVVNQGIESCGESDAFTLLLSQIRISELLQNGVTDNMLQREELNFFGHNIGTLSFQESVEILQQRGYERNSTDSDWEGKINYFSVDAENSMMIDIMESFDRIEWSYLDLDNANYPIGIRDISTCNSMAEVFAKLGFSNGQEICACIMDISRSEISASAPSEYGFIQQYIAETGCSFLLDFGSVYFDSAQHPIVLFSIAYHDIGHNETYFLDLDFRDLHSNSPNRLNKVSLERVYLQ